MNYLFFDIECANCFGGRGKICSLGYVLADSNFKIIDDEDILINPASKFHLKRADGEGIVLGYSNETFRKSPKFDFFYERIKRMLENPDVIVFGHSVINDINFLLSECRRYRKPFFTFKAFDTQIMYKHILPDCKELGLGKICAKYGIDVQNLHRSDYDAYLTMHVLKIICQTRGVSIEQLLEECASCCYEVNDGVVTSHYVSISNAKKLTTYASHVKPNRRLLKNSLVKNMTVGFSQDFEKDKFKQALFLVNAIKRQAGNYSAKTSKLQYFLAYGDECPRTKNVMAMEGTEVEVLTEKKLLEMLHIAPRLYEQIESWSISKIKSYGQPKRKTPIDGQDGETKKENIAVCAVDSEDTDE